jgi:Uma2 family endonuclease
MSTTSPLFTASQLEENPPEGRWELVRGQLHEMSPAGGTHGWIVGNLTVIVGGFIRQNRLGRVFGAETGFLIEQNPDTVRAPDFAFVGSESIKRPRQGFLAGAPDLAVEVISPNDTSTFVNAKSEQWLRSGCQTVWLIDPARETAAVCTLESGVYVMRSAEVLTDAKLLPGFELPVSELFQQ